jgi:hypothetical protein
MNAQERINNQNQSAGTQEPTKEKIELRFKEPVEFEGQSSVKVTTTLSLCRLVNNLFRALPDYEGCVIDVNKQTGLLFCSLFFHLSQPGKLNVIQSADQMRSSNSIMEKYNRMSAMSQNKKLFLTDLGKDILFDFIYRRNPNQKDPSKVNWNAITREQYDRQQYGQGVALLEVTDIDLGRLIPKFYKNPDKRHYQWNLQIIRPAGIINNMANNYLVQITRLDCKEVEELGKELGFFTPSGSIPIVR